MSIKSLPQDDIDKIKSSVAITTLNGVINGLLRNSLDASATTVYLNLDYAKGNCTLEDNGDGIPPQEFGDTGGLCKLHHTSRQPPGLDVHGRRGDFLAALASLSLLTVTSKHINHRSQNAILIHNGQVLSRRCPAGPEQQITAFEHGTRVIVRDLFGTLPVRVKQRANMSFDKAVLQKTWFSLVRDTLALLLAWPSGMLVVLRNLADGRELRLKSPPAAAGYPSKASTLLMQALIVDHIDTSSWVPVSSSSRLVTVSGCISRDPVPTRQAQFISFGIQPTDNSCSTNVLFEEVNRIFRASNFGTTEDSLLPPNVGDSSRSLQSRRGPDQHPMFYLRIETNKPDGSQFAEDSLHDSDHRVLEVIMDVVRAICYGFLKSHRMRPQKLVRSTDKSPFSMFKDPERSSLNRKSMIAGSKHLRGTSLTPWASGRPGSPFDGWNRLKVGIASKSQPKSLKPFAHFNKERLIGPGGTLLRRPFQETVAVPNPEHSSVSDRADTMDLAKIGEQEHQLESQNVNSQMKSTVRLPPSKWLADVVRNWENPVFENVELTSRTVHGDYSSTIGKCSHHWSNDELSESIFDSASVGIRRRLHKDALISAEVINQVDNKFILTRLPLSKLEGQFQQSPTTLVMLDQHAVDERCRLEGLMANYFSRSTAGAYTARSEAIDMTLVVEISEKEYELLKQYQKHFAVWGVLYAVQPSRNVGTGNDSKHVVKVISLPPSIIERCRTEPRLLIDLLRDEIWHLSDGGLATSPRSLSLSETKHPWVGLFRGCPRGILDLLHSRSCRSAIMFNDPLTKEDCAHLVERLSRCAFPFQCAHGRPSMAPILDLGTEPRVGAWPEEESAETRRVRWKTWMHT